MADKFDEISNIITNLDKNNIQPVADALWKVVCSI